LYPKIIDREERQ